MTDCGSRAAITSCSFGSAAVACQLFSRAQNPNHCRDKIRPFIVVRAASNNRREQILVRLRRLLRDVAHDRRGALIQKVAHLTRQFLPGPSGILLEKEADDCQEQENQRRERKHSLVGKSSSQLRCFVFKPFRKRLFQQTDCIGDK